MNESNVTNIEDMIPLIENIIKQYFPKSYIRVYFSKGFLSSLVITFGIGQKSDWYNGYFENDPISAKYMIRGIGNSGKGLSDDGTITGDLEFVPLTGLSLLIKPPKNSYFAYDKIKFGLRKQW